MLDLRVQVLRLKGLQGLAHSKGLVYRAGCIPRGRVQTRRPTQMMLADRGQPFAGRILYSATYLAKG